MNHFTSRITGGRVVLSQEAANTWRAEITTREEGRRRVCGCRTETQAQALAFIGRQHPEAACQITRAIAQPYFPG